MYLGSCSGLSRTAAPVGHALTQAAPPLRSLHMSHFTAFFCVALGVSPLLDLDFDFLFELDVAAEPGLLPRPNKSDPSKLVLCTTGSANLTTP